MYLLLSKLIQGFLDECFFFVVFVFYIDIDNELRQIYDHPTGTQNLKQIFYDVF